MGERGAEPGRERLEPRLSAEQGRERSVLQLLVGRPSIQPVARSGLLDAVRGFLPKMAQAEVSAPLLKLLGIPALPLLPRHN